MAEQFVYRHTNREDRDMVEHMKRPTMTEQQISRKRKPRLTFSLFFLLQLRFVCDTILGEIIDIY